MRVTLLSYRTFFCWLAASLAPGISYSQEIPVPSFKPPAEQATGEPTNRRLDSPQEVIAAGLKKLRKVEVKVREALRQDPAWFAVDEALAEVMKSLNSDDKLSSASEIRFAKAALTALIPDDLNDKEAIELRNEVIALLAKQAEGKPATAALKHKWLAVEAGLKRFWSAARAVESVEVQERHGLITVDLFFEAEQRLLNAKNEFARSAFFMFPIDHSDDEAGRKTQNALDAVKRKHIQESWASAFETWLSLYARHEAGVFPITSEAMAREEVYYYQAKWHEAKARSDFKSQGKVESSENVGFRRKVKGDTTIISLMAEGDTVREPVARRANIGGYIGLLQDQQRIRNQEINIAQLHEALSQFESLYEAERIDYPQILQVRSELYREQCVLLDLMTTYDTKLNAFKLQLGLPPHLKVKIEDDMIDTFNLIDGALNEPQERLAALQSQMGRTFVAILQLIREEAQGIEWSKDLAENLKRLKTLVASTEKVRALIISENVPRARRDIERLTSNMDSRSVTLNRLRSEVKEAAKRGESLRIEPTVLEGELVKKLPGELERLLKGLEGQFNELERSHKASMASIDNLLNKGGGMTPEDILKGLRLEVFQTVPGQFGDLSALTLELALVQAQARTASVDQGLWTIPRNTELKFELRRQLVVCAIDEVMLARNRLQEPPRPDQFPGAAQQLGATTAVDLVSALNNLKNAQNDFVNIWVRHETLRRAATTTQSKN